MPQTSRPAPQDSEYSTHHERLGRTPWRGILAALLFASIYFGALLLGHFFRYEPQNVATFWPASGVLLSALLLRPPRSWPTILVAALGAHLAADQVVRGAISGPDIYFGLANWLGGVVGALLLQRFFEPGLDFCTLRQVLGFGALGGIVGPLFTALAGAAGVVVVHPGASFGSELQVWWCANSLGNLVVVPLVLTCAWAAPWTLKNVRSIAVLEALSFFTALTLLTYLVFSSPPGGDRSILDFPYLIFPLLLWAALRFGGRVVAAGSLGLAVIAVWQGDRGLGPFIVPDQTVYQQVLATQAFLAVSSFSVLVLAAIVSERRAAQAALQLEDDRYRDFLRRSSDGMARIEVEPPISIEMDEKQQAQEILRRGRVVECNDAFAMMYGYSSSQEMLGLRVEEYFPEPTSEFAESLWLYGFVQSNYRFSGEWSAKSPGGELRVFMGTITGIEENGRLVRLWMGQVDLDKHQRTQDELRASRLHLEQAQRIAHLGSWTWEAATNLLTGSDEFYRIYGVDPRTAVPWTPKQAAKRIHLEDQQRVRDVWLRVIEQRSGEILEYRIVTPEGEVRVVSVQGEIVFDRQGELQGMMGIAHNVTERKEAEEALRVSQERFAKAFQASPDSITISSVKNGRFIEVNRGFFDISGHRVEDTIGKTAHEIDLWYHEEDRIKLTNSVKEKGFARGMECIFRHKRGDAIICDLSAEIIDLEGEPYFVTVARDITAKRKADEELQASRQELRELTARLQAIREEERTVMSREIHDELGQSLTALKLDLSWLHSKLPADDDILLDRTRSMVALTSSTLESVRELASRLRPAVLDDLGLAAAIEWQTGDFAPRAGIECSLDLSIADLPPDPDRDTEVFRIIQESLTNVARHAEASRVEVGMHRKGGHLIVTIQDDSKGIPVDRLAGTQSLGLVGMRERATTLAGTLEVTRPPSGGTLVTLTLPYERLTVEERLQ